jgi:hypothetical protein
MPMFNINIHFHPTDFESQLPAAFEQFRHEELAKLDKISEQNKVIVDNIDLRLEQNTHLGDYTYSATIVMSEQSNKTVYSNTVEGKDYQGVIREIVKNTLSFVFKEKSKLSDHH